MWFLNPHFTQAEISFVGNLPELLWPEQDSMAGDGVASWPPSLALGAAGADLVNAARARPASRAIFKGRDRPTVYMYSQV